MGQIVGEELGGDLFSVLDYDKDQKKFELLRSKLNARADLHETHNPSSLEHLPRVI